MGIRTFHGHTCVIGKRNGLDVIKMDFGITLIQSNKSKGANMEPGGAPPIIGPHLEGYCLSLLSISTLWELGYIPNVAFYSLFPYFF